ncbi:MAG: CHAT domain-containing protein [Prochloron sp. SP5CPC1]|nr:CHAT domain-containing protein [Candidatus Paraprochloron terpiosi SP5CPC1]
MKLLHSLFKFSLAVTWIAIAPRPAITQTNNQSDITGPNPIEIAVPTTPPSAPAVEQTNGKIGGATDQRTAKVDRQSYETRLQTVNPSQAVALQEAFQAQQFSDYTGIPLYGEVPSAEDIANILDNIWQQTGEKPGFIHISSQTDQIELFLVVPQSSDKVTVSNSLTAQSSSFIIRETVPDVANKELLSLVRKFQRDVSKKRNPRRLLQSSQQLYQWLIAPIEDELKAQGIEVLVLSMDSGLRGLPVAALHDGEQYLVEKYALAIVPCFGLADIGYTDIRDTQIIAMGASEFTNLNPLPSVPLELATIAGKIWSGKYFLNREFTVENFTRQNQQQSFGIIHLATHGEFKPGRPENSYIQFYDRKLTIPQFRQLATELGWIDADTAPIELLVLSACRTAVGDEMAELGFAGLAVAAGVKSVLASLWYVSDAGTLALMTEFYSQLSQAPIKAQALRRAQLAVLKGEVYIENGFLYLSNGERMPLPPEIVSQSNLDLSNPFFWSAFTLIGNWN